MSEEKVNIIKGEEIPEKGVSREILGEDKEREEVREPRDNYDHYSDHTFHNNVTIGGVLRTKRFCHPHGGLFLTEGKLLEELPDPRVGWWAMVGAQWPMQIYICREAGKWSRSEEGKWEYTHRLDTWEDYIIGNGDILSADLGYQLKEEIGRLEKEIGKIPSLTGYATQTWVEGKGYATQQWVEGKHYLTNQSLSGYATEAWVKEQKYLTEAKGKELFASLTSFERLKAEFESMFEKVNIGTTTAPVYAIRAKHGLYTEEFLSARGINPFATDQPVGLDEKRLGEYLVENGYVKRVDLPSLTGYATEKWVTDKNYLTSAALTPYLKSDEATKLYQPKGDYLSEHQNIYGLTFAAGSFTAKSYNPKSAAATVNIPTTTSHITEGSRLYFTDARAQNALAETVKALNTAIDLKLDTSTFEDFKKLWEEYFTLENKNGEKRIRANYGLYTESFLSARGMNGTGATVTAGLDWKEIEKELGSHGYATQSWVEDKKYLTQQSLANYYTKPESDNKYITKTTDGTKVLLSNGGTINYYKASNITSATSDDGIVTPLGMKNWVEGKKYLTSSSYTAADVLSKLKGVDGTGSGLDADLVDGKHNGELTANMFKSISGEDYDLSAPTSLIWRDYGSSGITILNRPTGFGYGTCFTIPSASGLNTALSGQFAWDANHGVSTNITSHLWFRTCNTTAWDTWHQLAFTTDNVASANQLKTSRTLWGQSFNGTGNVTGSLSSVGNVSPSADNTYNLGSASVGFKYGYMRWIGAPTGAVFQLGANNGNHMYIGTDGKVGIGTTSPAFKLDVNGETCIRNAQLRIGDCARQLIFRNDGSNTYLMYSDAVNGSFNALRPLVVNNSSGNIGLGNGALNITHGGSVTVGINLIVNNTLTVGGTNSNGALEIYHSTPYIDFHFGRSTADYTTRLIEDISGRLKLIGTFYSTKGIFTDEYVSARGQNTSSDERLKGDIRPIAIPLDKIAEAPSVAFTWNDNGKRDVGSIAQYWKKVNPMFTPANHDGYLTLQYGKAALLATITIARTVKSHEERIAELERENQEMKKRMEALNKA